MYKRFLPLLALPILLTACDIPADNAPDPTIREQQATAQNQENLLNSVQLPQLQTSLERKNLARRLEHINKEGQTSYIYLINFGKVMAYYAVSGKVSSLNSYLTGKERIIPDPACDHALGNGYSCPGQQVESPDLDGSYGQNDTGIFFFTTEGTYVEWHGDYLWSDQPLALQDKPTLIMQVK